MPSAWRFGRYGITYVLPSLSTERWVYGKQQNHVKYGEYLDKLQELYAKYRPKDKDGYIPYDWGMNPVSDYIKLITETVPSKRAYYTKNLLFGYDIDNVEEDSLQELYTYTLGYLMSKNLAYQALSVAAIGDASIGMWGSVGKKTVSYFIEHEALKPDFSSAHRSETYLAAMNVLSKEELQQNRRTLLGIVNCPVDVTIKDDSGEIVGQIVNNEIMQSSGNGIVMAVDGDSKTFSLPIEAEYTVELTGNDDGFMDYSLCEIDPDTGEVSRTYYSNVPVSDNATYTQKITEDSQIASFELKDEENNIVESTGVLTEENIGQLSVDVTVEGIGSANGLANLSQGDYVSLEAIADENNEFLGWYDMNGNLMSADNLYSFSIQENQSFVAKFTDIVVDCTDIQFEKESLEMEIGEESVNTATMFPENATYKWIRYSSSDTNVVEVGDYGLLKAIGKGTATITATSEDGKAFSTMTVTVKDDSQEKELSTCTITLTPSSYTYDGTAKTPTVTVTDETKTLSEGTDYTVNYQNNTNIGMAKAILTGMGNYKGTVTKTFTIVETQEQQVKKENQTLSGTKTYSKAYGNKPFLLDIKLKKGDGKLTYISSDKKVVKVDAKGRVTIKGTGIATITVEAGATTNYNAATIKVTVKVSPAKQTLKSSKVKKGRKLTISWKKDTRATGYQIQYSTDKKFKKGVKKVTVNKNKTISKAVSKLTAGKSYYVRVRSYKSVKVNGKTQKLYGAWSNAKRSGRIKK